MSSPRTSEPLPISALALLFPVLLVSYLMLRSSFGRLEDAKQHVERLNGLYLSTIETLATAIDAKDDVTHDHVRRVQGAAVALAKELGISDPQLLKAIEAAGLLHDTGKIAVPEHILTKPGTLIFVSEAIENIPSGFRARETYTLIGPDEFEEVFELAEPGKDFALYSRATLKRAR